MSGNIQGVDIKKLESSINEYDEKAQMLESHMFWLQNEIDALSYHWSGKRVNAIINTWNGMNDSLADSAQFFHVDVMTILEEIRDQYKSMENEGKAKNISANHSSNGPSGIRTKTKLTDENIIKFSEARVIEIQKEINKHLDYINNSSKGLVNSLDGLKNYSDSLTNLVSIYRIKSKTIEDNLQKLKNTIGTLVNDAVNVVRTTESYNEKDVERLTSK